MSKLSCHLDGWLPSGVLQLSTRSFLPHSSSSYPSLSLLGKYSSTPTFSESDADNVPSWNVSTKSIILLINQHGAYAAWSLYPESVGCSPALCDLPAITGSQLFLTSYYFCFFINDHMCFQSLFWQKQQFCFTVLRIHFDLPVTATPETPDRREERRGKGWGRRGKTGEGWGGYKREKSAHLIAV